MLYSIFLVQKKKIKLSTLYENDKLQLKGSFNLIKQLGLDKAYESISNKCYDLHKGPDGISKTWKEVEIHVKAPIIFTCNQIKLLHPLKVVLSSLPRTSK